MNLKEAKKITGGLSSPSKMPGYAYNLPAWRCITGVKLQAVKGSVCAGCYAMKGRYRFPNVREAMDKRLAALADPRCCLLSPPPRRSFLPERHRRRSRSSAGFATPPPAPPAPFLVPRPRWASAHMRFCAWPRLRLAACSAGVGWGRVSP